MKLQDDQVPLHLLEKKYFDVIALLSNYILSYWTNQATDKKWGSLTSYNVDNLYVT